MRHPAILNADSVIKHGSEMQAGLPDGRWVAARPYGFQSWRERLHATWLVFTGKADALKWTGQ